MCFFSVKTQVLVLSFKFGPLPKHNFFLSGYIFVVGYILWSDKFCGRIYFVVRYILWGISFVATFYGGYIMLGYVL